MLVFRIERKKYLKDTLKGIGAALSSGFRWNTEGTFMVYTAGSRALSMLEVSVHLDLSQDLPKDRYMVEIEIPDNISIYQMNSNDLPEMWNAKPSTLSSQIFGNEFINQQKYAVMRIPSAIIPEEFNYLINPHHPDAKRIFVKKHYLFKFDNRIQ